MGRLINADDFYNKLNDLTKEHQGMYNGAINDCMNLLDEQPTAYDVSKVVVELKKLDTCKEVITSGKHPFTASEVELVSKKKVIEIVRRGELN